MGRKMDSKLNAQRENRASWKLEAKLISGLNQQNYLKNKLNPSNKLEPLKLLWLEDLPKK